MSRAKRVYSIPFVVTVAAAIHPGCDPKQPTDGGDDEDTVLLLCDVENVSTATVGGQSDCSPGYQCRVALTCTSGVPRELVLECASSGEYYVIARGPGPSCENPYEACVGAAVTSDCIDGEWRSTGQGGNPPAPCPTELPDDGAECRPGDAFGTDRRACGYPCGSGDEWTVTGCVGVNGSGGSWQSDSACEGQGGAPEGGAPQGGASGR